MANLFPEEETRGEPSLLRKISDALSGGVTGLAQGASDIGANIAQFPGDIPKLWGGKPWYEAPKPNIRGLGPQSELGKSAEVGGEFLAPWLASPTLAAETAFGKAMYGGRLLPRLITDMLGGAAESSDRGLGAIAGLAAPALGEIKRTPWTKHGATKRLNKADELLANERNIPLNLDFVRNLEYQMGSKHLSPNKQQLNTLMGRAAEGSYPAYRALQSSLGDISRELTKPSYQGGGGIMGAIRHFISPQQTSAAERLTGKELERLRQNYINNVREYLTSSGKGKAAALEKRGMEDYARYMQSLPKKKALALSAAAGIPGFEYFKKFAE